nr:putative ribonuclease H-like domain-containing protein [Tanacetum cinerariifolium]
VAFGENPKGGKITGKGKIKTSKLDFDDVYFVKELKFNLFSVSQMCNKKNSVLFTNTKCLVLSSDFKLPDENHVLLMPPRGNNMYNVDLKNIVPLGDLTCLFAKATLDESNLWHRRLGHINFKSMNKLVKGKQHRASCKTKPVSFVSQPLQRVLVTKPHNKTPYELLLGRTPSIGFMRPFGCPVTILNTLDPLGKFDGKDNEGFLVGYSISSKAFRVFNSKTKIVKETLHINFLENQPNIEGSRPKWLFDIDTLNKLMNYQPVAARNQPNSSAGIQGNFDACKVGKETVSTQQYMFLPLWSTGSKDPQNTDVDAAFDDKENKSEVYVSPRSSDKSKKHDEKAKREVKGKITAVGPNSPNSTNNFNVAGPFDNVVSPNFEISGKYSFVDPSQYPDDPDMPALEDIVYSDDKEDVGVEADFSNLETRFEDPDYPDKVYKVVKDLYGLHQAPRAWYETLANYLLENGFQRGKIDQTLFIKNQKGLQVKQKNNGIFISLDKYVAEILRKFSLTNGKSASTPIDIKKPLLKDHDGEDVDVHIYRYLKGKPYLGLWYPKDSPFKLVAYSSSDYAGASLDRKSTIRVDEKDRIEVTVVDLKVTAVRLIITVEEGDHKDDTIRQNLRLDDADGIDCLPNEEIFTELARMGYEKPSTKLTFYKTCGTLTQKIAKLEEEKIAQALEITKLKQRVKKLEKKRKFKSSGLKRLKKDGNIAELDADKDVTLVDVDAKVEMDTTIQGRMAESQAKAYNLDLKHSKKVLSMQDTDGAEPAQVEEVLDVVTAAKLMTEVVTTATPITTVAQVLKASAPRKRRGVVIQDPKETTTASVIVHIENDAIDQVKRSEKQDHTVMRYQALKKKLVTEAHERKNMMIYLKNMVGFKMNFFKGMAYNEIRSLFDNNYNSNQAFLERVKEEVAIQENEFEEEGSKRKSKSLEHKIAKKQRMDEEAEELKRHLQIAANDDDVYIEATPLASKNFDREDLEALWKLVKEIFESTEPKNFLDDFLLNILKIMFEKPNVEANV